MRCVSEYSWKYHVLARHRLDFLQLEIRLIFELLFGLKEDRGNQIHQIIKMVTWWPNNCQKKSIWFKKYINIKNHSFWIFHWKDNQTGNLIHWNDKKKKSFNSKNYNASKNVEKWKWKENYHHHRRYICNGFNMNHIYLDERAMLSKPYKH